MSSVGGVANADHDDILHWPDWSDGHGGHPTTGASLKAHAFAPPAALSGVHDSVHHDSTWHGPGAGYSTRLETEHVVEDRPWPINIVVIAKIKLERIVLAIHQPFEELRQRIDLIVMTPPRKAETLLEEVRAPRRGTRKKK